MGAHTNTPMTRDDMGRILHEEWCRGCIEFNVSDVWSNVKWEDLPEFWREIDRRAAERLYLGGAHTFAVVLGHRERWRVPKATRSERASC